MVKIEVYYSPVCPHCPGAKKLVAEVASRYGDSVEVEEINTYTPEGIKRGMAKGVMSVPTVFVVGERKFVGFPFKEPTICRLLLPTAGELTVEADTWRARAKQLLD